MLCQLDHVLTDCSIGLVGVCELTPFTAGMNSLGFRLYQLTAQQVMPAFMFLLSHTGSLTGPMIYLLL